MKKPFYWMLALLVTAATLLSACTSTTTTQTPGTLPALPTAQVPPLGTINQAITSWQNSGNTSYFLTIDERTPSLERKINLVVNEGTVRAAQQITTADDGSTALSALPQEEATQYTVDAILARVLRDARGEGPAPVNLEVIFDSSMGMPSVILAEGMPSYTASGTVQLNRQYSYSMSLEIKALVETGFRPTQAEEVLIFTRGFGPEAWCDKLTIFADNQSHYVDDCVQTSQPLSVPETRRQQLADFRAGFDRLEATRQSNGGIETLVIIGTGSGSPDQTTINAAWELADALHELLSYPLGAGVTLLYEKDNRLYGMSMLNQVSQQALINPQGTLYGASQDLVNRWLAISDESALRATSPNTNENAMLAVSPTDGGYYVPRSWNTNAELLVTRYDADGLVQENGVFMTENPAFAPLPAPQDAAFGCDSGVDWANLTRRIAISEDSASDCSLLPGLHIVDLQSDRAATIVSRSINAADGSQVAAGVRNPAWSMDDTWVAFSMDEAYAENGTLTARLFVVHPDGSSLAPVSPNTQGIADNPVWLESGELVYSLNGAPTGQNGIYVYNLSTGETRLLIEGEGLQSLSLSPDGEFLLYADGQEWVIYSFLRQENLPERIYPGTQEPLRLSGWLAPIIPEN